MPAKPWTIKSIASLDWKSRKRLRENLTTEEFDYFLSDWQRAANDAQLPPEGDWDVWLFLGGRGAGKTRAGAEWVADRVRTGRAIRVALIAATHSEARSVMIEGPAGLLACSEGAEYEPSLRRVTWPASGAVAAVLSADDPDSVRGHQFEYAWGDEFAKWPDAGEALDMIRMGLRLGEHPQLMLTTTPRPLTSLIELATDPRTQQTKATTLDNAENLAPTFLRSMEKLYKGTRLGRQELDGEIIEDNEDAAWRREWIDAHRVKQAPELERVVVGVDPPASKRGDACGIVVAGLKGDQAYVLADYSRERMTSTQWGSRAADAYENFDATCVVAEVNQGGDMVEAILNRAHPNMKVRMVHAMKSKLARAEPIAALYEQGRVHHAGVFAQLEDEMCQYDGSGGSPDRMDALVWALTELFPQKRVPEPNIRFIE